MFKIVHNIFFVSRFQKEAKKIMEVDTTCEMDKVTVLKKTDNDVEFSLPYGWKKFGHKRKNSDNWDFYLISSDNKRFRSNPEIKRYLENNPTVKCDLSVTNTQWSSALKNLKKPNLDLKEPESELFIKSKTTSIIPKLLKISNNVSRSPPSKNNKDKICKERMPESFDQACDGSVAILDGENAPDLGLAPNSKSDSGFSIEQSKRMLIEKIKGIKSTRHEINSKNVALSKICDDTVEYSLPYGWKKVCHKRKRIDKTTDAYRWDIYIIHPDGKKFRSTIEVERYLDENPDEKCDRSVTTTTPPNDLPKNKSNINKNNDKDEKLNSGIKKKHALKVRKATKTTEVESCGFKSLPILSLATNFSDIDKNGVSAMELDDEKLDIKIFNPWNVSDLSVFLKYCCPECDFKCKEAHLFCDHAIHKHENSSALLNNEQYETSRNILVDPDKSVNKTDNEMDVAAQTNLKQEISDDNYENFEVVQEFDNFDEEYILDEEPETKSGKQSLDLGANFHDFSEKKNMKQEIYNDSNECYEAVQELDNFDEQYSLDEEPKTKSGQKVARKRSSNSQLNFHDFSEEAYNGKTEMVEEDIIANKLNGNPQYDEKYDPLPVKSAKKEENTNEGLDGVAADLKKYECTICNEKFRLRRKLAKHTYDVHEGTKPFKCELCEYGYFANFDLTRHIHKVHT